MCYRVQNCGDCPECLQEEQEYADSMRDIIEFNEVCIDAREFEEITPSSDREYMVHCYETRLPHPFPHPDNGLEMCRALAEKAR